MSRLAVKRPSADDPVEYGLVNTVPAEDEWIRHTTHRHLRRRFWFGERHEPPVSALNPVVAPAPRRAGICCSGGGIRSASFNLGALQAIQGEDRLRKTRFLSAVSGGSYIASAFAMVAKTQDTPRDPPGDDSDPDLLSKHPPFYPGSPEEQYLRNRASYMAPTGGAKVYLVWRIALGLLVNLVFLSALITLVAAAVTLYYRGWHAGLIKPPPGGTDAGASPESWIWGGALALAALGVIGGLLSLLLRPVKHVPRGLASRLGLRLKHAVIRALSVVFGPLRRGDGRRLTERWSLIIFGIGLLGFCLELVVPALIEELRVGGGRSGPALEAGSTEGNGVGAGLVASVTGIIAASVAQLRATIADPVEAAKKAEGWLAKLAPRLRLALIYLATAVLGPFLLLSLFLLAVVVQVETTDPWVRAGVPAAALLVLGLFLRWGDLNTWSLHPFYRARLCTAFALRRVEDEGGSPSGRAEARVEGELVPLSYTSLRPIEKLHEDGDWPTLLVCAAANVSDPGAAPPGRGVTSFTFSPWELGGPLVGGVSTREFETRLGDQRRDFTLPAAVAMSGAAISPTMGKLTRPSIRFLLAMANVRLGVWMANPRRSGAFVQVKTHLRKNAAQGPWKKVKALCAPASFSDKQRTAARQGAELKTLSSPRPTPLYLLKELVGKNSINDKFLYVTDGGHYDNLGLVELLRRGCGQIYCFDASGGRPLAQLGDAIALARSELGVEIEFPKGQLEGLEEKEGIAERPCAIGTVKYTRCDPVVTGKLVYVPTVMTKELPWDVHALKKEDGDFPRHSTLDQLFTDQKFEAYRILGYCGASYAMKAMDDTNGGGNRPGDPVVPDSREVLMERLLRFARALADAGP